MANLACRLAFAQPDVMSSEEKLSVEVAHLDSVVVCHVDGAVVSSEAHKHHHLDELAAQSTSPHQESIGSSNLFNELGTEENMIVSIAVVD